jgi:hypothetical protein
MWPTTLKKIRLLNLIIVRSVIVLAILSISFYRTSGQEKDKNYTIPREYKYCGGVISIPVDCKDSGAGILAGHLFRINDDYDQSVSSAQRIVIQYAINEWDDLFDSSWYVPDQYHIDIRFASITNPMVLASTLTSFNSSNGNLLNAEITFDGDGSTQWYIDPNPANDDEFHTGNPPDGIDLLSVARHEIGHAIGWTGSKRVYNLLSGDILDQPGLNIVTVGDTGHTDPDFHPNSLMVPAIAPSVRHGIEVYPDVSLPSKAYYYWVPEIRCIDASYTGPANGSLYHPWPNGLLGLIETPEGGLLIAMQGNYPLVISISRGLKMKIISPREKIATIYTLFK